MSSDSSAIRVRVVRLPHARDLPLPVAATPGSSGSDLRAALGASVVLESGDTAKVPTGLSVEIPIGWEAQVRPRSGLAAKHGVTVLNAPGTIDSDYRGEIAVLLINHGSKPFRIEHGDRIAQIVFARVETVVWAESQGLASSARGGGGFGSTGS